MHPSFEQFITALRMPEQRAAIRLVITDADASSLLSRDDWARDYYARWIGMFPPETAAADPAASDAQHDGLGVGARVLLVGLLVVCVGVGASALIIPTLPGATRAANAVSRSGATPSALATDANGLTAVQTEFVNAELAVSNSSISQLIAGGTTQKQLHDAIDVASGLADVECTAVAKTPGGFDTPGAKEKFIAAATEGITLLGKTITPTSAQAERLWTATVAYCAAK